MQIHDNATARTMATVDGGGGAAAAGVQEKNELRANIQSERRGLNQGFDVSGFGGLSIVPLSCLLIDVFYFIPFYIKYVNIDRLFPVKYVILSRVTPFCNSDLNYTVQLKKF